MTISRGGNDYKNEPTGHTVAVKIKEKSSHCRLVTLERASVSTYNYFSFSRTLSEHKFV